MKSITVFLIAQITLLIYKLVGGGLAWPVVFLPAIIIFSCAVAVAAICGSILLTAAWLSRTAEQSPVDRSP